MSERIPDRFRDTFKYSNAGERFRPVKEFDHENERFIEKGKIDMREYINSGFVETDLYSMIERYKIVDNFPQPYKAPFYGDVTDMPTNMYDLPPSYVIAEQLQSAEAQAMQEGVENGQGTISDTLEKDPA